MEDWARILDGWSETYLVLFEIRSAIAIEK